jgi:preprotein translocase subunit YajC
MGDALGVIWLQAGEGSGGDPLGFLIPMGAIFLIFYFLLIRPQQKKQKDHENLLKAVGKGDRVVTSGGIHAVVVGVADDVLTLEIGNLKGERVKIKVDRGRIDRRIEKAKGEES